jgi:hypothetical protein
MLTLLIEHSITDFDTWHTAFRRFAERRKQAGAVDERILQPIDDPHYVFVELDFVTIEEARSFKHFLQTQVWATPKNSPALAGAPRARIAETRSMDLT